MMGRITSSVLCAWDLFTFGQTDMVTNLCPPKLANFIHQPFTGLDMHGEGLAHLGIYQMLYSAFIH